jgi:hypothetical protein
MTNTTNNGTTTTVALAATPADYIAIAGVSLTSAFVVCTIGANLLLFRRYEPLRARNVPNLTVLSLASLVHLWATLLVAFRHVWPLVYNAAPLLWTPWLEYFFGLGAWTSVLALRLLAYGLIFGRRMRRLSDARKRSLRVGVFLAMLAPPLCFALIGSFRPEGAFGPAQHPASGDAHEADTTWYTWVLFVWLVSVAVSALVTLVIVVRRRRRRNVGGPFDETRPLRDTMIVSAVVLFAVAATRSAPAYEDVAALRMIVVLLVCVLHGFTAARYAGRDLWRALRNDRPYRDEFMRRYVYSSRCIADAVSAEITPEALSGQPHMLTLFLMFYKRHYAHGTSPKSEPARAAIGFIQALRERDAAIARKGAPEEKSSCALKFIAKMATADTPPLPLDLAPGTRSWPSMGAFDLARPAIFDEARLFVLQRMLDAAWSEFVVLYGTWAANWKRDENERNEIMQHDQLLDALEFGERGREGDDGDSSAAASATLLVKTPPGPVGLRGGAWKRGTRVEAVYVDFAEYVRASLLRTRPGAFGDATRARFDSNGDDDEVSVTDEESGEDWVDVEL